MPKGVVVDCTGGTFFCLPFFVDTAEKFQRETTRQLKRPETHNTTQGMRLTLAMTSARDSVVPRTGAWDCSAGAIVGACCIFGLVKGLFGPGALK